MATSRLVLFSGAVVIGLVGCASQPSKQAASPAPKPSPSGSVASSESAAKGGAAEKASAKAVPDPLAVALSEPTPFEKFGKGSVDRRARVGDTRARHKTVFPFEVAGLPTATVKAGFKDEEAPRTVSGAWAKEVVAKKNQYNYGYGAGYSYNSVTVEGEGFSSGSIRVGAAQGMFYRRDGAYYGGVSVMCGPNEGIQSIRWEGLVKKKGEAKPTDKKAGKDPFLTAAPSDDEATYEIVDGWFDRKECKAVAVRRQTIKLKTVVSDTLYAFRDCDEAGCDAKTTLGLVIPYATAAVSQNDGTVLPNANAATRILVPVRRGGSEGILASTYRAEPGAAFFTRTLSVEIIQGTADEKPFATAFVEDPR